MSPAVRRAVGLWLLVPLMVFGIGVSLLMTWHHDTQLFGSEPQQGALIGCSESATVSCDIVNTSDWSELFGVPIAALSASSYATVLVLAVAALRGSEGARALVAAAGAVAVVCSAVLFWVSKIELGYVCAWCLRLYAVNIGILVLGLLGGVPARPDRNHLAGFGLVFLGLLLVGGGAERLFRASLTGDAPAVATHGGDRGQDPRGDAPVRAIAVQTEDDRSATLTIDADDAWTGAADGAVTVVMFGDLECGYCKRSSAELSRLEATYGDRVLFVYKHFPMDPACNAGVKNRKHKDACAAARGSVCAQAQGLFWAFHDLAYKNQHQLGPDYLRTYAERAGADLEAWDACMAGPEALATVQRDAEAGAAVDIHGTPRIFIDGQLYRSGASAQVMARAIELALGASAQDAAKNAASLRVVAGPRPPVAADTPPVRPISVDGSGPRIDTFEAAIGPDGAAVSAVHQVPALHSSWFEADAACRKAGKRMCTEAEWVSACQGAIAVDDNGNGAFADDMIEGTAYPYGDVHEPGRCWDARPSDDFRPVYTGEMPGCASATGAYDLTGNLEEWVGETPERAVLLGGAWDTDLDHARCYRRNDTFGAGYASPRTGFRCCAD